MVCFGKIEGYVGCLSLKGFIFKKDEERYRADKIVQDVSHNSPVVLWILKISVM
jgi:hypothetical protein